MTTAAAILGPFIEFGFMRSALLGCVALSVSAAPVGVFLMLRRMSLSGDAMAHAILPGAGVGFLIAITRRNPFLTREKFDWRHALSNGDGA